MRGRKFNRVRWKVVRAPCGQDWHGVILIGEIPIHTEQQPTKAAARKMARAKAEQLRDAGV